METKFKSNSLRQKENSLPHVREKSKASAGLTRSIRSLSLFLLPSCLILCVHHGQAFSPSRVCYSHWTAPAPLSHRLQKNPSVTLIDPTWVLDPFLNPQKTGILWPTSHLPLEAIRTRQSENEEEGKFPHGKRIVTSITRRRVQDPAITLIAV